MSRPIHLNNRKREEWEIRDNPKPLERGRGKEHEPEPDVDLEIVEIGEADPTIEQERRRKRIGEVIGNEDVDDFVDRHIKRPSWGPKKGEA